MRLNVAIKKTKNNGRGKEKKKNKEENTGRTLNDINQSKILYDPSPRVKEIKTEVNKWNLINLKAFAQQRKL